MNSTSQMWGRIPEALRLSPRWCIAGPDKAPYFLPHAGAVPVRANVKDPRTWMPFDAAAGYASTCGAGIGYICHPDDPFTCIDLDIKDHNDYPENPEKWTTQVQKDRAWHIVREFESYTEYSRSGRGLHLWVGGKIGAGARRENVEIYSQERFIICTGNVVVDLPINKGQPLLDKLLAQVRSAQGNYTFDLVEREEVDSDQEIIERAMYASNSEKFNALCCGQWEALGYPSQSEADTALLSMFTFYSPSNVQVKRLFRMCKLGKREKAQKNDRYLDTTLRLIRGREDREAKVDAAVRLQSEAMVAKLMAEHAAKTIPPPPVPTVPAIPNIPPAPVAAPPAPIPSVQSVELTEESGLPWPPGTAGEIAQFVYNSAPRPVKEVAIVAALGLLAGVLGRAYTIPQSGLNMYIILVARSAIGKEAMHTGISHIMKFARESVPPAMHFVDFNDYVSGPALVKKCADTQSFVNVAGEWGKKLKRLSNEESNDGPMQSLRTAMTNLYQKSGPTSIVGGMAYSNKDNNVASVSGVAYSMIGETTPDTFYEALTDTMMADGFLSRFTVIEYTGDRPNTNHKQVTEVPMELKNKLGNLFTNAININAKGEHRQVGRKDDEVARLMQEFDAECDYQIRSTQDESWRQMWNRAHLKVLRIAALLAVADNDQFPVIEVPHLEWAKLVVRADIAMMTSKIKSGDVGKDDTSRQRKLLDVTRDFFSKPVPESYGIPIAMKKAGIIPRKYLQLRVQKNNSFSLHRLGAIGALDSSIRSLCDSGYFVEVAKDKIAEAYAFHGKCYRVLDTGS